MRTCQKIYTGFFFAVMIGMYTLSSACNMPMRNPNQSKSTFELVMLNYEVAEKGYWGNSIEDSWSVLQAAYPAEIRCRIDVDDIEGYDWDFQVITLTSEASQSFDNGEQDCLEPDMTDGFAWYHLTPFIVALDNVPIYGGLVIPFDTITARAFNYPTILYEWVEGKLVLRMQPGFTWDNQFTADEWQLIKDDRIRELFLELGKLR